MNQASSPSSFSSVRGRKSALKGWADVSVIISALCCVLFFGLLFALNVWNVVNRMKYSELPQTESRIQIPSLYPPGLDEGSCISRYESLLYHSSKLNEASPYLVSKLRTYEARHKRCVDLYNKTVLYLKYNTSESFDDCKYIVWISSAGFGNKMMTISSTFLYALLTDRVLLIDRGNVNDISKLFCEPFPGSSWYLPLDFPLIPNFKDLNKNTPDSFGNLLKYHSDSDSTFQRKNYVYLHLRHDFTDNDQLLFCDQHQSYLRNTTWLVIKSNAYFIPSLFSISSFERELYELFPDKEIVFHLLGRYLFHPTDAVWALVSRYYDAYLSKADVKVGIQIRITRRQSVVKSQVLDQILSCSVNEGILPAIDQSGKLIHQPRNKTTVVAVLIVSLDSGYFKPLRDHFWENQTATGEYVSVQQPSYEEHQQFGNLKHDMKALAEIYLLSLTDKLITSSWSTFGYAAQGLGGLRPWLLYDPKSEGDGTPPCGRMVSMEPCFHTPPRVDCRKRRDPVNYLVSCEDATEGLKLVQSTNHR